MGPRSDSCDYSEIVPRVSTCAKKMAGKLRHQCSFASTRRDRGVPDGDDWWAKGKLLRCGCAERHPEWRCGHGHYDSTRRQTRRGFEFRARHAHQHGERERAHGPSKGAFFAECADVRRKVWSDSHSEEMVVLGTSPSRLRAVMGTLIRNSRFLLPLSRAKPLYHRSNDDAKLCRKYE